ncbi:MAG: tRNA lysidine(34) synthetase TilS, partial [Acidiferrobacter sp.]
RIGTRSLVAATRVLGQRVLIPGRGHRALKKLLQELGIAPWDRPRAVLIFVDDALIAVADHWICQDFRAGPYEAGLAFHVVP